MKNGPVKELKKKLRGRRVRDVIDLGDDGIQIVFGNKKTLTIKHKTSHNFFGPELEHWTAFLLDNKEILRK